MAQRTQAPTSLGEYDLLAPIGEGGAGVVYKARHRPSEAIVAVKLLHAQQAANRTMLKRFQQEFRAAQPLNHPHLVRVFDLQEAENTVFLVMEYIDGRSLGERLERGGALPLPEAVHILTQIAQALDWLHDQGILHRDVKPDNIVVSSDGNAKLTDLGLVKELLLNQSITRTGAALGTPNFMAPEQFRDAKRVDRRCDVYSLGATFYQMVTGVIPFQMSAPFDAWVKKTRNDFAAPRELVRDLPEGVDWAIRRAMSSDPQLRPATCGEFVADIVRATELEAEADSWELVFESLDGPSELLRVDTASVRQLIKRGNLRGRILARRSSTVPFAPLDSFPEFRNTLPPSVPNTPPAPNRAPAWTKTPFGDETPKANNANLLFNFLLALVVLAVGFALTALLKF